MVTQGIQIYKEDPEFFIEILDVHSQTLVWHSAKLQAHLRTNATSAEQTNTSQARGSKWMTKISTPLHSVDVPKYTPHTKNTFSLKVLTFERHAKFRFV